MTDTTDDEWVDVDQEIEKLAQSVFTDKGPQYNPDFAKLTRRFLNKKMQEAPESVENIIKIILTCGMVNASVIPLLDEAGAETVGDILIEMGKQYHRYIAKPDDTRH